MPPEEEQKALTFLKALKESGNLQKFLFEFFSSGQEGLTQYELKKFVAVLGKDSLKELKAALRETGNNDALDQVLQYETRMAANKATKIGIACGVVTALAVGIGCFAAGVALPMLAIAGIAVAAALAVGLIAGYITYAVSKPNSVANNPNVNNLNVANQIGS